MKILKGVILISLFSACQFILSGLSAQNVNLSETGKTNTTADSLSLQIQTYESIVAELQTRPVENSSLAHIMTQLGNLYSASEDYPKAIYIYMRSIILRQYDHSGPAYNKSDIAWQLIEVGNSFYRLYDHALAEQAYRNAAKYFISNKDYQGLITAINNIGLCRLRAGNPESALPVFSQMLDFSIKINDAPRIYASTIYLSMALVGMENYAKSIEILTGLKKVELDPDDLDLEDYRVMQLGDTYMKSGDTTKAISTYKLLTGPPNDPSDIYYKAMVLIRLADYYQKTGSNSASLSNATDAYELLQNQHHLALKTTVNEILYKLYSAKGDYRQSLKHFEEYHSGVNQLNRSEIQTFISDYNKKMERIAISQELRRMREKSDRIMSEKSNQQSLSTFLIIIAVLLLVMLFTAKGFDSRIQLLLDHVKAYSSTQKAYLLLLLGMYFIAFYYFFVPVENAIEIRNLSFLYRLMPGFIAYAVTLFIILMFYSPMALRKPIKNWYVYSLYVFGTAFISVLLAEFSHFYYEGFGSLNFLLSLSLIVLASFIVPLYLFILVVENLIIKHIEAISQSLNRDIDQIKLNILPSKELITIQSEKTSGKVTFSISDLMVVEAQGNYCMFYLMQNEVASKKMLHITMKAIEEQLGKYDFIIRCHKSFLVNIQQISKVSGNSRGYFLHFDTETEPVPVSRGFQKDVMGVIRRFKDGIS